jgi:hypothetical protein
MSHEFDGLDATEKAGIEATLNRCRALATQILNELRNKIHERFVDKLSLADVHASLERGLSNSSSSARLKSSGALLPPSPPAEKATARQDQAGKASTGDGAWHN